MENYPCSICNKSVKNDAIFCNLCELWVHPKCNYLDKNDFSKLSESNEAETWFCFKCNCIIFPFNSAKEDNNSSTTSAAATPNSSIDAEFRFSVSNNENSDLNCKFYDKASFNKMISESLISDKSSTSFFHLNINSLSLHIDDLVTFLSSLNHSFDIIGLSETRILINSIYCPTLTGYQSFFHFN